MESVFHHVGVAAKDPIALERFYTDYFGFERARVYAPGEGQVVMIKKGNFRMEIFKAEGERPDGDPKEAGPSYASWRHVAFMVDSIEEKMKELGDAVKVTLGPLDFKDLLPGLHTIWVADPEGNIIEISEGYVDDENPPSLAADEVK